MYLKILQNVAALITFQNSRKLAKRSSLKKILKVEFFAEQFHNEKLSYTQKENRAFF